MVMVCLKDYWDFYEGFLKGMEDIYTLVWKRDMKAFELPSLGNWDYEILTNMYSVGYYKGYCYYQKRLLTQDEYYICFKEVLDRIITKFYNESQAYALKKQLCQ